MSVSQSLKKYNVQEPENEFTFKPEINKYSKEIYSDYLIKLNEFDSEGGHNENNDKSKQDERLAYIERLINKKKKKDTEN